MLHKIWRYSHFYLTVSSSLFLLLAAVTGAFLAFKPIQDKLQPFYIHQAEDVILSTLVDTLTHKYDEVLDVEIDNNYFVKASVFGTEAEGQFYINPFDGNKLADLPKSNAFFESITNFHRSLFLKTPGRIFVGITSFLLFLIAITGLLLAIKRQGGFIQLCSKIVNDKSIQYNHVALGRLLLIPIVIVAFTGTYLSMEKLSLLPKTKASVNTYNPNNTHNIPFSEFAIFKNTKIKEITKLEFPFSTDEEDYFTLSLKDRELKIHQKTGEIVKETRYPFVQILSILSFNLHTGTGSILWSIVLLISSVGILYFMYSGAMISYYRIRSKTKNKFTAQQAEFIILVGSENGGTKRLGKVLQQALLKANQKVFVDDLNNYQNYPQLKQLLILTSTYGQGEPPSNANLFLNKLQQTKISTPFECHVIGFGSFSYPKFCEFAKEIHAQATIQPNIHVTEKTPLLIHNQNYQQFRDWTQQWAKSNHLNLSIPQELSTKKQKEIAFKVTDKINIKDTYDETFTLSLTPTKRKRFVAGDLLSITPPQESTERLYSIGTNSKGDMLLSIKKHDYGVCSNYLNNLNINDTLKASIQQNKEFHFPKKATSVTLIANGTGIAPFLGMIHQKTKANITLYWGTRTKTSTTLYHSFIAEAKQKGTLHQFNLAFSKEVHPFNYVQDLLVKDEITIAHKLKNGDVFMLCGSIAMRNAVFIQLEKICIKHQLNSFDIYKNNGQILTDCY
ncbi:PepSY domain-containing protein [Wenyingzhuangia aestuarii]|uniref:PepSY domain-containing protein n=1 Tax=Wenyingzhuangia aestuarii TaxID=1647582 RepID=UPI00143885C8|nr:PepSY domain-containing protein [Wenyingzhuangia aestuarii]NJB82012.1 sulfite reductase (NADPH) flavoprotein alpha-component [Wenyingzhuangia aestuarii]